MFWVAKELVTSHNTVLLYSTESNPQDPVINMMEKNMKKNMCFTLLYTRITLSLYTSNWHNIVNQL